MGSGGADVVPPFGRRFLDGAAPLGRIGEGSLGGKASGLAEIIAAILPRFDGSRFPELRVDVPRAAVLTTDLFDAFLEANGLRDLALSDAPDDRIALAFLRGSLPPAYVGDLRALLQGVHQPLAVRSSSLLEDALDHPLAGVYATKMIPNQEPLLDRRHKSLLDAVKLVWASTFFADAKAYLASIGRSPLDEKMAVVVQEVVGRRFGDRFYPAIAGVARSYNYYPIGNARADEGVVSLALGLGKTIVDGGLCWTYSPAFPASPPPFADTGALMKNTQTHFFAVNMGPPPPPDPTRETEHLVEAGLEEAERDGLLGLLASTYDPGSDRVYPGLAPTGPRVLDFAPLLRLGQLPLNEVIRALLAAAEEALAGPVELELAVDVDPAGKAPARLGCLQVRPMRVCTEEVVVTDEDLDGPSALVASTQVMGNGTRGDLSDVVYLKPEAFEAKATRQIAGEVEELNRRLAAEGRPYVLIGFGRWGSSDPWLGVPVAWSQISAARVIVEAAHAEMSPDLSQGSHFFHNMVGFKVLYLSVGRFDERGIDWGRLGDQTVVAETPHARHVRLAAPLAVRVDGTRRRGVVTIDEGPEA